MLKTPQVPIFDPLKYVRSFADSMAEGLLGPEDIGVLYHAISYAEAQIRPVATLCNRFLEEGLKDPNTGTERAGGVASDCNRRAA